ncbi:MAG: alanine acetyltransferase [Marinosulfonomonas sp.]|nr:MAG: alanine acetyltransferase [Marinosulfonomonas sp.]
MLLQGSCHCQAVKFSVESQYPYPFNLCYCGICRKTAGAGEFVINLHAEFSSLNVTGGDNIRSYSAKRSDPATGAITISRAERKFCGLCGSALWLWDPRWPDQMHPHVSAIDTELPVPPARTHLMLGSKPDWVQPDIRPGDKQFDEYPDEGIADWHIRLGLAD